MYPLGRKITHAGGAKDHSLLRRRAEISLSFILHRPFTYVQNTYNPFTVL